MSHKNSDDEFKRLVGPGSYELKSRIPLYKIKSTGPFVSKTNRFEHSYNLKNEILKK